MHDDEQMQRKLAAEARIRERNARPPGPLHERAAAIFNEWAKQAALANPQTEWTWAWHQDRKQAALREAERQLQAEASAPSSARVLSRREKREANSVAFYAKAIKTVMAEGTTKEPEIQTALRARFGDEFFPTNYKLAWKQIPRGRKAKPGRPRK